MDIAGTWEGRCGLVSDLPWVPPRKQGWRDGSGLQGAVEDGWGLYSFSSYSQAGATPLT